MKKPGREKEGISYWESMADGVVGLLLCVLLIVMLLILLLLQSQTNEYIDMVQGDNTEDFDNWDDEGGFPERKDEEGDEEKKEDQKEEGETDAEGENGGGEGDYDDPDPGSGEGDGSDKAAVLVHVIDGETHRTVKKAGIQFELYRGGALQILSTYYPVKTDYKKYETDKNGTFFLPEKIILGSYSLHGLTSIEGYDVPENKNFAPDHSYEWDEPFTVKVPVYPSKNIVRIQLSDRNTGNGLTGASFHLVVAEDIVTKDGTTRYRQGEIADTIIVADNGYGESKEVFVGKYFLRQDEVPQFYGAILEDVPVDVESKSVSSKEPPLTDLKEQKTTMRITLTDALYEDRPIEGAAFEISEGSGNSVRSLKTDKNGMVLLNDLRKGITYKIRQTSTVSDYQIDPVEHEFSVTSRGLIEEGVVGNLRLKNRIIRATFTVRDKIFRSPVSDVNISVLDSNDQIIQRWDTSATEKVIEGLAPGQYRVIIGGNGGSAQLVTVEDQTDLQVFSFDKWTIADFGAIAVAVLLAAGLIASIVFAIVRLIDKKRKKKEEGMSLNGE